MNKIFKQVRTSVNPVTLYTYLEWELYPTFTPTSGHFTFYVDYALPNSGTWTRLNSVTPVTDDNHYEDQTIRKIAVYSPVYYRIVLVDGSDTYYSSPINPLGSLTRREFVIFREAIRREYVRQDKQMVGVPGYLLKRKYWGTACTHCLNEDTGVSINSQCTYCYGTGILGGYTYGFPYKVELLQIANTGLKLSEATGSTDIQKIAGKAIAYPYLDNKDVWVSSDSGDRYFIDNTKVIAAARDNPILYEVTLVKIPIERVEYQIPLAGTGSTPELATASWNT